MSWRRFFRRGKWDEERARELASYLETETEENVARGMTREEASRAAHIKLGNATRIREEIYEMNSLGFLETLGRDLRYAVRMLRKSPGFTIIAVLTLALGIGANTAVFSVVDTVLLKPLPYPHPEQLANVWRTHGRWTGSLSIPDFRDWQAQNTDFQGISAFATARFNLRGASEPQAVEGAYVTANFFSVMQVAPLIGRGFTSDEEEDGQNHVAILGYELWVNQFGGDRAIVGKDIRLSGASYTVIGVAPPGFHYPSPLTSLWVPLTPSPAQMNRGAHDFLAIGRVKAGVSFEQATTQLNTISARLAKSYPDTDKGLGALLIPLKDAAVGRVRSSLLIVFGIVGFIFLIACANVSSYMLSRAESRRRELAIRTALGASRGRLVRQFFAESLALALGGALLAALTARWSVAAIVSLASHYFSDPGRIQLDSEVFVFTFGLATLAAVLLSVGIAWNASRVNVQDTLKEGTQTVAGGRRTIYAQRTLVVLQISAACLLLVGASGMIESLAKLSRINPGFNPSHLLVMRIPLSQTKYSAQHPVSLFLEPVLARIDSLAGVEGAGLITYLPMQSWGTNSGFQVQGKPRVPESEAPWAELRAVSADYFRVMGIHLLEGRWFTESDNTNTAGVIVVNREFVHRYFADKNVVGKRIDFTDEKHWMTIVGVVEDSHQTGLNSKPLPEADLLYSQSQWGFLTGTISLAVRTKGDPLLLAKSVEQVFYSADRDQAVYGVKTMDDVVADTEADQRFVLWLLGLFAALAVALASAGLFGQMSYAVSQRTHEIGIRMALGAQRRTILRMILGQGALLIGLGTAIGLAASFGVTRLIANLIYGLKLADAVAIIGAVLLLAAVGLLACYIPARRATRVDPIVALRHE